MINHFLATLDNVATAPANFIWPTFTPRTVSGLEAGVRGALIGVGLGREQNFLRCLQLVNLVQESPLVGYVTSTDTRLTYTKQALRDRFALSGVVVQDTSDPASDSTVTMIVLPDTPEITAWTLEMDDSTHCTVTDDSGRTVTQTMTYSSGTSNLIDAPLGLASFRFTDAAPASGESWDVSYQAAGASWIPYALARLDTINPVGLLNADLLSWYNNAPTKLDKLAAIVAALGTAT